jgi:hypothetical protein
LLSRGQFFDDVHHKSMYHRMITVQRTIDGNYASSSSDPLEKSR